MSKVFFKENKGFQRSFVGRFVSRFAACVFACALFVFGGTSAAFSAENYFTLTLEQVSAGSGIKFNLSASGEFTVDCGEDGKLIGNYVDGNKITRVGDTHEDTYECSYSVGGDKIVTFSGTADSYNTSSTVPAVKFSGNYLITGVGGNMSYVFPDLGSSAGQYPIFYETFKGCGNLAKVSDYLFVDYTMGHTNMFYGTFADCVSLQSVAGSLFSGITTGAASLFQGTFAGCTSLDNLPETLFSGITNSASNMFRETFYGCSSLGGYIPAKLFQGLVNNSSPNASNMMTNIFYGTSLDTSCPGATLQYITGYESYFGSKVACEPAIFTVSTTNLSANTSITFKMSAKGTFKVNCGDGTLSGSGVSGYTVTRNNTTEATYTCAYSTSGSKIIGFGGTATAYNNNVSEPVPAISFYDNAYVRGLGGNMSAVFPDLGANAGQYPNFTSSFQHCTNLTSLSSTLFSDYTRGRPGMFKSTFVGIGVISIPSNFFGRITTSAANLFYNTFGRCLSLTTVPSNLFAGITTGAESMFDSTFSGCTSLTSVPALLFSRVSTSATGLFRDTFGGTGLESIPEDLFASLTGGATEMFRNTFSQCRSLTSIPGNLFRGVTTAAEGMFYSTFSDCEALTSLPEGLFSGISTSAPRMFQYTFMDCDHLTGYIPPSFFAGLIANNSPYATDMMDYVFYGTTLATTCPSGLGQYTTNYESYWNSKVSCLTAYTVTYSCGTGASGTAPSSTSATYLSSFTPASGSGCTGSGGYGVFSGWLISGTNTVRPAGTAFSWNYTENKTLTAQYNPNTISVTWDDETTNSCVYGGSLDVEEPEAQTGYIFMGWSPQCSLLSLNANQTGSAYCYKGQGSSGGTTINGGSCLNSYSISTVGDWWGLFNYGRILGTSKCVDNAGESSGAVGTPSSTLGVHCWCKVSGYVLSNGFVCRPATSWVYMTEKTSASECRQRCPNDCTYHVVHGSAAFRAALYGLPQ